MKSVIAGLTTLGIVMLLSATAFAHSKDKVYRPSILLRILSYDTGYGTAHSSYVFGHPVRGDIQFRTIGERDTRREGWGQTGYGGWRR